jgi:hypothetical protein
MTSPDLKYNYSKIDVYFLHVAGASNQLKQFPCTNVTRVNETAVVCQGPIWCSSTVPSLILELDGIPSDPLPYSVGGPILKKVVLENDKVQSYAETDAENVAYLIGENFGWNCKFSEYPVAMYSVEFNIPWNNASDTGFDEFAAYGIQPLGLADPAQSTKLGIYIGWCPCFPVNDTACRIYPPQALGANVSIVLKTLTNWSPTTNILLENAYSYAPPFITSIKPAVFKSSASSLFLIEGGNFAFLHFSSFIALKLNGAKIFIRFHHAETGGRFTCLFPQISSTRLISCIFPELAPGKYYVRVTIGRQESKETIIYTELTNRAPVVQPLNVTVARNGFVKILINATDPDNDRITYRVASDPKNGQLYSWSPSAPNNIGYEMSSTFLLGTPYFIYRPFATAFGQDVFSMVAEDPLGLTTNFTVNVLITFAPLPAQPIETVLTVYGLQDEKTQIRIQATNVDGDIIPKYMITKLPSRGVLWDKALQKHINSAPYNISTSEPFADLEFEPSPGESGNNYASFLWNCQTDRGLTMPENATVSIRIQVSVTNLLLACLY